VIVNLIAATTTKNGTRVRAELDQGLYPEGINISDAAPHTGRGAYQKRFEHYLLI